MKSIYYKGSIFHYDETTDTLYLFSPAEDLYIPSSAQYDLFTDALIEIFPEDISTDDSKTDTCSFNKTKKSKYRSHSKCLPNHDISTINFKKVSFLKPDDTVPAYENVRQIYIAAPIDNLIADNRNFPNLEKINFFG